MQSEQIDPSSGKVASLVRIVFFLAVCVAGTSLPNAVDAKMHICRDADGKMAISKSPCTESSKYSSNTEPGKDRPQRKRWESVAPPNAVSRSSIPNSRKGGGAEEQKLLQAGKLGPATCKHQQDEIAASYRRGVKVYDKNGKKVYRKDAAAMKHLREWERITREACS